MSNYKGIGYLRNKLQNKQNRVNLRYSYYEMKNALIDRSNQIPPSMKWLKETLGWCGKAVDSVADRLQFRTFKDDNFDINNSSNDYGYGEDYLGYQKFVIDPQFNCKGLKSQTINAYFENLEENPDHPGNAADIDYYLIDNDYVTDLSNVTINCEFYIKYGQGYGSTVLSMIITSDSMTHTPIINYNTKHKKYSLKILNCPNLIELNCSNCFSNDYRDQIYLDQNNLIYFRLGNYRGQVYLTSEILDIPTLEQSILANTLGYYNFSIKRSIYNQISQSTLEVLLDRATQISIIEN